MQEFAHLTVYATDPPVFYVPFVADDGRVGYRVCTNDGGEQREAFIYFNPSGDAEGGTPNVFVYVGGENDPAEDEPFVHYSLGDALAMQLEIET